MKTVENSYALASSVRDLNCRGIHLRWSFSLSLFDQRGSSAESVLSKPPTASVTPPRSCPRPYGETSGEYQENTNEIRREYEENTKTTPEQPPSNPPACGLPHALDWLAPACPLPNAAAKATGIRAAPNHPQQSKPEARHYGPEPALRRLSRSAHPCAPFPVDHLRYLPQAPFRYEKKLGINSQFVPYYLLTGKTFLTNNS